jgi:hypothetical protein
LSGPLPTTVRYLNTLKPSMIGGWSAKSSDSASSNIIYWTSASESPILRPNSKGYCRPKQLQRGDWSLPISNTLCLTFEFLAPPSPVEEGEITTDTRSNGKAWSPSRWGHLV